jgi:hypothetical protein
MPAVDEDEAAGMTRTAALAGLALLALAAARPLDAPAARKAFFGIDMAGVYVEDGSSWRECVAPNGETSFWHRDVFDQGRLRIRDDGALCFTYASRGFADEGCYRAFREGQGFRFVSDGPEGAEQEVWVTRSYRANVKVCEGPEPAVS